LELLLGSKQHLAKMTHMKKKITYTLMAAVCAAGVGCTNLDEHLPGQYTQPTTVTNPGYGVATNANKPTPNDGMAAAFNQLLNGIATNGGFFAVQEGGTDEAVITQKGGDWYDGGLYIRIHQHIFTPQTWSINGAWNDAYGGIYQCNSLLPGGASALTNPTPDQNAQLRFLRAFFHWRIMELFGNGKIITKAGVDAPQVTRTAMYNFIESEVLAAIPDLSTSVQDYGRVNQYGAYAFLSRLYLNAEVYTGTAQWQKASDAADKVIQSGLYTLAANYGDVFSYDNCCNNGINEILFTVPFDQSTGQGATWHEETLHYPSQLTWNFSAQPWNGFATLEDFYNMYDNADVRKQVNFLTGQQYASDGVTPLLDLAFTKGYPNGANLNYTPQINELYPNSWRAGGARFAKFKFKFGAQQNDDNDFPLLRYGEVLLNRAEAGFMLNGWADGTALSYMKMITDRAKAPLASPMTSAELLKERGRELFIEALRRTDMIRLNGNVYVNGTWWEHPAADTQGTQHNIMPIPIEQITAATGTAYPLTQNPGY
jgi:hypothetical protein